MLGSRVPPVGHWLLLSRGYVGQSWEQYLWRSFGFISGIRERVARCLSRHSRGELSGRDEEAPMAKGQRRRQTGEDERRSSDWKQTARRQRASPSR